MMIMIMIMVKILNTTCASSRLQIESILLVQEKRKSI